MDSGKSHGDQEHRRPLAVVIRNVGAREVEGVCSTVIIIDTTGVCSEYCTADVCHAPSITFKCGSCVVHACFAHAEMAEKSQDYLG